MKKSKRKNKKAGLPPGSVVYTGHRVHDDIIIESIAFNSNSIEKKELNDISEITLKKDFVNWINIDGIHNVDYVKEIGEKFKIDNFILEDIVNVGQRPKIELRDNLLFMVLKMMDIDETTEKIEVEQLSIVVGENFVLTLQEKRGDVFKPIRDRMNQSIGKIRTSGSDYLAYSFLDIIVDNYFLILEHIEEEIDFIENKLINQAEQEDLEKILKFKQEFASIKRGMHPVREIVSKLNYTGDLPLFGDKMKVYISDVYDHTIRINEMLENTSSRVTTLVEIYHSTVNKQMNDTMKVLTIITTIFVPLSLLTGIYGMNFEYIPLLKWKYGYHALMFFMVTMSMIMIYFFKKKKWI